MKLRHHNEKMKSYLRHILTYFLVFVSYNAYPINSDCISIFEELIQNSTFVEKMTSRKK
jgi:hypothetical protein